MAEIVRKIGKITKYETKSYVGRARILDLDRSAPVVRPRADEALAASAGDKPGPTPTSVVERTRRVGAGDAQRYDARPGTSGAAQPRARATVPSERPRGLVVARAHARRRADRVARSAARRGARSAAVERRARRGRGDGRRGCGDPPALRGRRVLRRPSRARPRGEQRDRSSGSRRASSSAPAGVDPTRIFPVSRTSTSSPVPGSARARRCTSRPTTTSSSRDGSPAVHLVERAAMVLGRALSNARARPARSRVAQRARARSSSG